MDAATALALIQLFRVALKEGIPALNNLFKAWEKVDPTLEDFTALQGLLKKPEDYLQEG